MKNKHIIIDLVKKSFVIKYLHVLTLNGYEDQKYIQNIADWLKEKIIKHKKNFLGYSQDHITKYL